MWTIDIIRDSYLLEGNLDLLSLRVGVFQMELFCLYWHIWSKLMILSNENLTEEWKFGKSSTEMMGKQIGFGSELVIVKQWGIHWSKFRITEGPTFVQIFCLVMFGEPTSVSITDCMLGKSRHRRTSKGALLRMSKSWITVCWRGVHISFQCVIPIQGRFTMIIGLAQLGIHWGKLVSMPGVGRWRLKQKRIGSGGVTTYERFFFFFILHSHFLWSVSW